MNAKEEPEKNAMNPEKTRAQITELLAAGNADPATSVLLGAIRTT
jgi:hypothetical protein